MGLNTNPMDLVDQINKQTDYNAETTTGGKIEVRDDDGVVKYEISSGNMHKYKVQNYEPNGGYASVNSNEDVVDYINGEHLKTQD